ncbi:COG3014 family protein [Vibrio cincinnatiensis]|uniref:COG3014 family protein n=1 Tax=Vibrio cincinnatiensis TaxID=675 RepID=UPI001FA9FA42
MSFYLRHIFPLLVCLLLSACAQFTAGNLFSHYSAQNNQLHQAVKAGDYSRASGYLSDHVAGDILDNLEKGRVYFLDQQYALSRTALELSDMAVTQQQEKAMISVSSTATSIGALAINDNLSDYTPADYELGFLHLYLGLNYLQSNQLEGALVEMRRANQVQEQARRNRQSELERAQKELRSNGVSPNIGAVLSQYPDAGTQLQAVQNGYLFYLSALLYEASNDLNSAYVDYRRALAVAENNSAVIDGILRVAQRLGMREDLRLLSERYGAPNSLQAQQGRVIIIEEQGVVDKRQCWRLSLPLSDSRGNTALYSLALPYYEPSPQTVFPPLQLNQSMVMGNELTDVRLMAQQDLSERIPTMVIRQALRVVTKDQIRKESTQSDGVGNLLINVFNTLTEQPDTRSWLTLPDRILAHSEVVTSGEQVLQVGAQSYRFTVPDGGTTLVWLSRQGSNATLWHKQLGRL